MERNHHDKKILQLKAGVHRPLLFALAGGIHHLRFGVGVRPLLLHLLLWTGECHQPALLGAAAANHSFLQYVLLLHSRAGGCLHLAGLAAAQQVEFICYISS